MLGVMPSQLSLQAAVIQQQAGLKKAEILTRLQAVSRHEISQGDVATEVDDRGIDFALDDATLAELRQAGAKTLVVDALLRAEQRRKRGTTKVDPTDESPFPDDLPDEDGQPANIDKWPMIEQARYHALNYSRELPNFIVDQRVNRFTRDDRSGKWVARDFLDVEVTFSAQRGEAYRLKAISGRRVDERSSRENYDNVSGATSTGEFGSVLFAVFSPQSRTQFKMGPKDRINGRSAVIYDFRVLTAHSTNKIIETRSGQSVVSGYRGSIWVDEETKRVLRIEQSADDIPRNFPINVSEAAIDYDWFNINTERYLLPRRAEIILGSDRDRYYSRNVIDFKNYRKFETDIKITGGDDE
jgi:hypothetical protein